MIGLGAFLFLFCFANVSLLMKTLLFFGERHSSFLSRRNDSQCRQFSYFSNACARRYRKKQIVRDLLPLLVRILRSGLAAGTPYSQLTSEASKLIYKRLGTIDREEIFLRRDKISTIVWETLNSHRLKGTKELYFILRVYEFTGCDITDLLKYLESEVQSRQVLSDRLLSSMYEIRLSAIFFAFLPIVISIVIVFIDFHLLYIWLHHENLPFFVALLIWYCLGAFFVSFSLVTAKRKLS